MSENDKKILVEGVVSYYTSIVKLDTKIEESLLDDLDFLSIIVDVEIETGLVIKMDDGDEKRINDFILLSDLVEWLISKI